MKCPRCGADVPAGAKSCGRCGAQFVPGQYCPYCGKVIPKGSPKCPKCGKAIQQSPGAAAPRGGSKKPLTRRWWFWAVCVVLVLGILGNISRAIQGSGPGQGSGRASPSPVAAVESPSPTPTAQPTATPSPSPYPTPTAEPTPTPAPSPTPEPKADQPSAGENADPSDAYSNPDQQQTAATYVLNTSTMKFHRPGCRDVKKISPGNYAEFEGTRDEAEAKGYSPCGHCNP